MSFRSRATPLVVACLLVFAAQAPRGQAPRRWTVVSPMASPTNKTSGEPGLISAGGGSVLLSWLETSSRGIVTFRVSRIRGAAADAPVTVASDKSLIANWADVPSVFESVDGTLVAHRIQHVPDDPESSKIVLSVSRDAGRTWTPVGTPHRDVEAAEHGFASMFDHPRGGVGIVWLDGRAIVNDDKAGTMLRTNRLSFAPTLATVGDDSLIDARVCDCCAMSAATTSEGVVVAYRDRSDLEVRDIAVSRFDGQTWTPPSTVHADQWKIQACPVNGPVIAARGRTVAVAWFTQVGGAGHSYVAFSRDAGRTFGNPTRLNQGAALGRLAIVMPDDASVLVGEIERTGAATALMVRQVGVDGVAQAAVKIATVNSGRASGFPRMALDGDRVIIAWTAVTAGLAAGVQLASLR